MNTFLWSLLFLIVVETVWALVSPAQKLSAPCVLLLNAMAASFPIGLLRAEARDRARQLAREAERARRELEQPHRNRVERRARKIGAIRKEREAEERRERARAAARVREEEERLRNVAREAEIALYRTRRDEARLSLLVVQYESFSDYSNPGFIEAYARHHRQELLAQREDILRELQELYTSQEFGELVRNRAPETYERATWRTRALALAERFDVEERESTSNGDPRKPTAEEISAWKVDHFKAVGSERLALKKAELEMTREAREFLDHYDLEPDERERHERELVPHSLENDDENDGRTL